MRTMVADDKDLFRVVIVKKNQIENPDYVQGGREPYRIYTDETHLAVYGPYNHIGPAKAVRTRESWDYYESAPKDGVVDSYIEKGETTWKKVEL